MCASYGILYCGLANAEQEDTSDSRRIKAARVRTPDVCVSVFVPCCIVPRRSHLLFCGNGRSAELRNCGRVVHTAQQPNELSEYFSLLFCHFAKHSHTHTRCCYLLLFCIIFLLLLCFLIKPKNFGCHEFPALARQSSTTRNENWNCF